MILRKNCYILDEEILILTYLTSFYLAQTISTFVSGFTCCVTYRVTSAEFVLYLRSSVLVPGLPRICCLHKMASISAVVSFYRDSEIESSFWSE